jgi:hypothetical protein
MSQTSSVRACTLADDEDDDDDAALPPPEELDVDELLPHALATAAAVIATAVAES